MCARNGGQRARVDVRRRRRPLDDVARRRVCARSSADVEAPGQPVQPGQRLLGVGQRLGRHLDGRAVVGPQHEQPVGPGVVAGQQVGQRGEVAERLGHLRALDLHPAVVHPVPGEGLAVGDRLGPLVLVVREGQVLPAAVQVEALAQQVERHDHALGVPAGPARPPGRVPARLARLGLLPQGEVERRALVLVGLHPGPDLQRLERLLGQEPVPVDLGHLEVDPVGRLVGHPLGHQVAHQRHHVLDVLRGVRDVVRAQVAQRVHRLPPAGLELGGHVGLGAPELGGPLDDVVVDVGDVGHVVHLQPVEAQVAPQDVEGQVGPTVADVGQVVDGRAADVHRHLALVAELEGADGARCGVVEVQHPGTVTRSCRPPRPERPASPTSPPSTVWRSAGPPPGRRPAPTASTPAPPGPRSSPSTPPRRRCRARSTWARSSATSRPTPSPATGACGAGSSSTPWAGTTTGCRPSAGCRPTSA